MTQPGSRPVRITKINVEAVRRWVYDVRNNRGGWHDYQPYITLAAACDRWMAATTDKAKAVEMATILKARAELETMPDEFKPKPKRKR